MSMQPDLAWIVMSAQCNARKRERACKIKKDLLVNMLRAQILHRRATGSRLDCDGGGSRREEAAAREPAPHGRLDGHDARSVTAEAAPLHQRKVIISSMTHYRASPLHFRHLKSEEKSLEVPL